MIRSVKTECEREERSFIIVAAVFRRELARERRLNTWDAEVRVCTVRPVTDVECVFGSCLMSCLVAEELAMLEEDRRSEIDSLY